MRKKRDLRKWPRLITRDHRKKASSRLRAITGIENRNPFNLNPAVPQAINNVMSIEGVPAAETLGHWTNTPPHGLLACLEHANRMYGCKKLDVDIMWFRYMVDESVADSGLDVDSRGQPSLSEVLEQEIDAQQGSICLFETNM